MPSNKNFGYTFFLIFLLIEVVRYYFIREFNFFSYIFIALSLIFLILTIFFSNSLSLLNKLWFKIGIFIGRITNPIILFFLYFILFFPVGIILKILKYDALQLDFNKKSFWNVVNEKKFNGNSLEDQF